VKIKYLYLIGLVIVAIIVLKYMGKTFNFTSSSKTHTRTIIIQMFNSVTIGDNRSEVKRKIDLLWQSDLNLYQTNNLWSILTPGEIGATNWILFIKFHEDKVVAVYIRLADKDIRPTEAPLDKK
jgi:hypothetical protein